MSFIDSANPTEDEIIKWAYDKDSDVPDEDWEIILSAQDKDDLLLKLASDPQCPKSDVFLCSLYILIFDAFRSKFEFHTREKVSRLLDKAEKIENEKVFRWVKRSRDIIANPPPYLDYEKWCIWGWINEDKKIFGPD